MPQVITARRTTPGGSATMPLAPPEQPQSAFPIAIKPILQRAQTGDPEALEQLKHVFDEYPGLISQRADLGRVAEASPLTMLAGGPPLLREAARRYLVT